MDPHNDPLSLETVRALHQTVVALRSALEESRTEIQHLQKGRTWSIESLQDAITALSIENHLLRQKVIDLDQSDYNLLKQPERNVEEISPKSQVLAERFENISTSLENITRNSLKKSKSFRNISCDELFLPKDSDNGVNKATFSENLRAIKRKGARDLIKSKTFIKSSHPIVDESKDTARKTEELGATSFEVNDKSSSHPTVDDSQGNVPKTSEIASFEVNVKSSDTDSNGNISKTRSNLEVIDNKKVKGSEKYEIKFGTKVDPNAKIQRDTVNANIRSSDLIKDNQENFNKSKTVQGLDQNNVEAKLNSKSLKNLEDFHNAKGSNGDSDKLKDTSKQKSQEHLDQIQIEAKNQIKLQEVFNKSKIVHAESASSLKLVGQDFGKTNDTTLEPKRTTRKQTDKPKRSKSKNTSKTLLKSSASKHKEIKHGDKKLSVSVNVDIYRQVKRKRLDSEATKLQQEDNYKTNLDSSEKLKVNLENRARTTKIDPGDVFEVNLNPRDHTTYDSTNRDYSVKNLDIFHDFSDRSKNFERLETPQVYLEAGEDNKLDAYHSQSTLDISDGRKKLESRNYQEDISKPTTSYRSKSQEGFYSSEEEGSGASYKEPIKKISVTTKGNHQEVSDNQEDTTEEPKIDYDNFEQKYIYQESPTIRSDPGREEKVRKGPTTSFRTHKSEQEFNPQEEVTESQQDFNLKPQEDNVDARLAIHQHDRYSDDITSNPKEQQDSEVENSIFAKKIIYFGDEPVESKNSSWRINTQCKQEPSDRFENISKKRIEFDNTENPANKLQANSKFEKTSSKKYSDKEGASSCSNPSKTPKKSLRFINNTKSKVASSYSKPDKATKSSKPYKAESVSNFHNKAATSHYPKPLTSNQSLKFDHTQEVIGKNQQSLPNHSKATKYLLSSSREESIDPVFSNSKLDHSAEHLRSFTPYVIEEWRESKSEVVRTKTVSQALCVEESVESTSKSKTSYKKVLSNSKARELSLEEPKGEDLLDIRSSFEVLSRPFTFGDFTMDDKEVVENGDPPPTSEHNILQHTPSTDLDQEVDDIELIFTNEDTKETNLKEPLISIEATNDTTDGHHLNFDQNLSADVSDRELEDDVFNDNFENENQENSNFQSQTFDFTRENSQVYNSKSDNSINQDEMKSLKSYYSYQDSSFENKSLEKDESFDRFEERIRIVETDMSKVGIQDVDYNLGRRNTCPNPLQYRPIVHREALGRGGLNSRKTRPILAHSNAIRRESGAQTDISALPNRSSWCSESSLAHKVKIGENFTTLPSKYPLPGSRLRLSEKTVEARRILLSDIGFTSMVPELSRSADHLCPPHLKTPATTNYGQFLRTTDLYSPAYNSQRFMWTTTASPSDSHSQSRYSSLYPLQSPPAPSRRCSAPVSPCRKAVLRPAPSRVRFANGSLPELRGDWNSAPDSGDSTDSLVEEAEQYLRRSIDCIVSGKDPGLSSTQKSIARRASAPEPARDNIPPPGWQPFLPRLPRDLRLDYWVKVITLEGRVRGGRVRYVGHLLSQSEQFVGVQLSTPDGHSDGTYNNRRYFQCEPYHGIFVPFKKVIMGWRP